MEIDVIDETLPDNRIADLHRKFASIRDFFPEDRHAFLAAKCTGLYDDEMKKTIIAFKTKAGLAQDHTLDRTVFDALAQRAGVLFSEVWQAELEALDTGKLPLNVHSAHEGKVIEQAHKQKTMGLAFSGGGIRSATFNLGIIQAMAQLKLLRDVDYLSTVSGGGYIGSWFSTLLHKKGGDIGKLEEALAPGSEDAAVKKEPDQIRFLRQYSNYLTPQTGMFSADSWALLATYFRNTVLNVTVLVAIIAGLLMLPRMLARAVEHVGPNQASTAAWIGVAFALWSVGCIALSISSVPDPRRRQFLRGQTQASILLFIVVPLMAAAFAGSIATWHFRSAFIDMWDHAQWPTTFRHPMVAWVLLPGLFYFAAWATGWACAQWFNQRAKRTPVRWKGVLTEGLGHFSCAILALAVGSWLLTALVKLVSVSDLPMRELSSGAWSLHMTSMGIPFMLIVFGITTTLAIGLVGRMYAEKSREWWSRQGGWAAICTVSWLGVVALGLYAPALVGYGVEHLPVWGKALIGTTWFGATAAGLLLGHSKVSGKEDPKAYFGWIAALAPLVFSIGALLLISTLAYLIIVPTSQLFSGGHGGLLKTMADYYEESTKADTARMLMSFGLLLLAGNVLALRVDVNKFSLNTMYRNRLVRAYMGAVNPTRKPHPFTGFDDGDDIHFDKLLAKDADGKTLQRPIHLINATINLVNGKELAWQTRKGANFVFSPAFCGFEMPSMSLADGGPAIDEAARGCYRPTAAYREALVPKGEERPGIKVGMAMATSGAAANPNMGYHSSPAMTFLMTLFNVRIGRWFANPLKKSWDRPSPRHGLHYLLAELFGQTDAASDYLNLSDGGHFENLGIYELVRRRCRLVVVVDAGADGGLNFEDLGNAIRKCYTDLNIQIDIDVAQIDPVEPSPFSRSHCVTGKILYKNVDGQEDGVLLYIKPTLLGTEFADLLNYRKSNKTFPHHSTVDQWFDETQFESYRSLGHSIGMTALAAAAAATTVTKPGGRRDVANLCAALEKQWGPKTNVFGIKAA
jgi:hypothetical protein